MRLYYQCLENRVEFGSCVFQRQLYELYWIPQDSEG